MQYQATTTEKSHICVSQQYRLHMMIEAEWEYMQWKNLLRDIFNRFSRYFQLNLDETSFLCNAGELKVIWSKDKPTTTKIAVNKGFNNSNLGWE